LAGVGITYQEVVTSSVIETVVHFLSEGGGTAVQNMSTSANQNITANHLVFTDNDFSYNLNEN
jgi:hypothetical protein